MPTSYVPIDVIEKSRFHFPTIRETSLFFLQKKTCAQSGRLLQRTVPVSYIFQVFTVLSVRSAFNVGTTYYAATWHIISKIDTFFSQG